MTSLTLVRQVRARPAIVFDLMTTAEGMARWWGPDPGPALEAWSDPRVGGGFRVRFRTRDGREHECAGTFLEVTSPTKAVMSWRWTAGGADPGESQIAFTLRAIPEGTEITFTHSLLHDEESRLSHEGGWAGAFAKLAALIASTA